MVRNFRSLRMRMDKPFNSSGWEMPNSNTTALEQPQQYRDCGSRTVRIDRCPRVKPGWRSVTRNEMKWCNRDFSTVSKGGMPLHWEVDSFRWHGYVMVKVRGLLVPPLVQPKSPEFPLGVLMVTLAVPGPVISFVVSVACNWDLLRTWVLRVVPLITTTEDDTMLLPFTLSKNPP